MKGFFYIRGLCLPKLLVLQHIHISASLQMSESETLLPPWPEPLLPTHTLPLTPSSDLECPHVIVCLKGANGQMTRTHVHVCVCVWVRGVCE